MFYQSVGVVILIPVIPWRYRFKRPRDPWRLGSKTIPAAAE